MSNETGAVDPRAAWVAAHQGALWRYLRYLGCDRERAADLLQEALVAGLKNEVHTRPAAQARAWLRTTARNLMLDAVRADRRRGEVPADLEVAEAVWQEQEESPRGEALAECLAQLDGRSRLALELRYRECLGWDAIGNRLGGLKEQGVKSLLSRLRAALRGCIERRCCDDR